MNHIRGRAGFTIVELLIVIVVIAILAAITIVSYNGIQKRAQTSAYASKVDDLEKLTRLAAAEDKLMPAGKTTIATCLGRLEDFPAKDGFDAGECFFQRDGTGAKIQSSVVDPAGMDHLISLNPAFRMGIFPVTRWGTLNARGIFLMAYFYKSGASGNLSVLQWVPPDLSSCGRAENVTESEYRSALNDAKLVVSGGMTVAAFNTKYGASATLADIRDEYIPLFESLLNGANICTLHVKGF